MRRRDIRCERPITWTAPDGSRHAGHIAGIDTAACMQFDQGGGRDVMVDLLYGDEWDGAAWILARPSELEPRRE